MVATHEASSTARLATNWDAKRDVTTTFMFETITHDTAKARLVFQGSETRVGWEPGHIAWPRQSPLGFFAPAGAGHSFFWILLVFGVLRFFFHWCYA